MTAAPGGEGEGPSNDVSEQLTAADGLVRLSQLVQGIHTRISERQNLTPVQARLLRVLVFGPRGMADLAASFGVEKAAMTGLVDRAERRGLVTRSPVPGDRRALHVTLTDTGRRAAVAFHAAAAEELNHLLSPLPPHDREHFRRAMTAVIIGSQGVATNEEGPPCGDHSGESAAPAGQRRDGKP